MLKSLSVPDGFISLNGLAVAFSGRRRAAPARSEVLRKDRLVVVKLIKTLQLSTANNCYFGEEYRKREPVCQEFNCNCQLCRHLEATWLNFEWQRNLMQICLFLFDF